MYFSVKVIGAGMWVLLPRCTLASSPPLYSKQPYETEPRELVKAIKMAPWDQCYLCYLHELRFIFAYIFFSFSPERDLLYLNLPLPLVRADNVWLRGHYYFLILPSAGWEEGCWSWCWEWSSSCPAPWTRRGCESWCGCTGDGALDRTRQGSNA